MKRHLELLVKQKFLTKNQYIQLMIELASKVGHPEKNSHSENWFSEDVLLDILHLEVEHHLGFKEAAIKCGVWNEAIEGKCTQYESNAIFLFQKALSIETGISLKIIVAAFNQLTGLSDGKIDPVEAFIESTAVSSEETQADFEIDFENIDPDMASDFSETFDEIRYNAMESRLLALEKHIKEGRDRGKLDEDLQNLFRDLHTIKGTSRFIYAKLIEKMIHIAEDLLGFTQKFLVQMDSGDLENVFSYLLEAIEIVWCIRERLVQEFSEKKFWENLESKSKYLKVYNNMSDLKKVLNSRELKLNLADVESLF